jgi:hypothetical protein
LIIALVKKYTLAAVAAGHGVKERAGSMNPGSTGHCNSFTDARRIGSPGALNKFDKLKLTPHPAYSLYDPSVNYYDLVLWIMPPSPLEGTWNFRTVPSVTGKYSFANSFMYGCAATPLEFPIVFGTSGTFLLDSIQPTVAVDAPALPASQITGRASDGESGVAAVKLSIRRDDGLSWSGQDWIQDTPSADAVYGLDPVDVLAAVTGPGARSILSQRDGGRYL